MASRSLSDRERERERGREHGHKRMRSDRSRSSSPKARRRGRAGDEDEEMLQPFVAWLSAQDDRVPPPQLVQRYDAYKAHYNKRHARAFVATHAQQGWFRDKYDARSLGVLERAEAAAAPRLADAFLAELLSGAEWPQFDADAQPRMEQRFLQSTDTGTRTGAEELDEDEDADEAAPPARLRVRRTVQHAWEPPAHECTLHLPHVPPEPTRDELVAALGGADKVASVLLAEPNALKGFVRFGWVTYKSPALAEEALALPSPPYALQRHVPHYRAPHALLLPRAASSAARLRRDLEVIRRVVRQFDDRRGVERNVLLARLSARAVPSAAPASAALLELEERVLAKSSDAAHLDLLIAYLRQVHGHDYYTGKTFRDTERAVLARLLVLRGTATRHGAQDERQWEQELDKRNRDLLVFLGDADWPAAEATLTKANDSFWRKHCVQEAAERYRCTVPGCSKMFRGEQWVQKHVESKHADALASTTQHLLAEQTYINYLCDPDHLLPTALYALADYAPLLAPAPTPAPVPAPAPAHAAGALTAAAPAAAVSGVAVGYRDLDQPSVAQSGGVNLDFEKALASFADF